MGGHAPNHLPPTPITGDVRPMLESTERPPIAPPRASTRVVSLIVASAMFMEQLDGTVLATALPTMARSFNADPLHMNIALTSYLLTLAMFIPASGRLADRFGSRTVFRGAIALFTVGSIACAQAQSLGFLVVARMLQGTGGALMSPVGRLVLLRAVSKADLFRTADFVSLHLVLSQRTRGTVGAAEFALMKPGAFLINTARSGLVDQRALVDALKTEKIGGAGLDVFDTEPLPVDSEILSAPNTVLTPHLGYATRDTYEVYFPQIVESIQGWMRGAPVRVLSPVAAS